MEIQSLSVRMQPIAVVVLGKIGGELESQLKTVSIRQDVLSIAREASAAWAATFKLQHSETDVSHQ
jgi:hypothetical protein